MREEIIDHILNRGITKSRKFLETSSDRSLADILIRNNFMGAYDSEYQRFRGFVNRQLLLTTFKTVNP